jgi:membrane protein YqaA with SNARE-associated domain
MFKPARKIYDWASQKATSTKAPFWLGVAFLLEMVLFIPFDALLMLFCWENPRLRYLYALVATLTSVITGLFGYLIGYFLWDALGPYIIGHLISQQFFDRLVYHYNLYEHWAVFLGSFLPLPFKAISISAGFCQLPLLPYVICVFFARAFRFFAVAGMMQRWGAEIKAFVDRHFKKVVMAFGAKIAITFTFFWLLGK